MFWSFFGGLVGHNIVLYFLDFSRNILGRCRCCPDGLDSDDRSLDYVTVPYFICLIQCAEEKVKKDKDIDNDVDKQLYSFRKYVAMWLVHDVVLGLFWLYLSITLHHLLKDDDSEWRTIFLSMISWHIIVFVIRELYFSTCVVDRDACFVLRSYYTVSMGRYFFFSRYGYSVRRFSTSSCVIL